MNPSVTDFYSETSSQFNHKYQTSATFIERFEVWTDLFKKYIKPSENVLDLGCGSGIFSQYLSQKGSTVLGIDGSEKMIDLCEKANTPTLSNLQYQLETLPFENAFLESHQFDVIISSSVIEYIKQDTLLLEQIHYLLKPQGIAIISFPNSNSIYRKIERFIFKITGKPAYYEFVKRLYDEELITQKLNLIGFEQEEIRYYPKRNIVLKTLNLFLPKQTTATLFVGVYRKKMA
jgi:2-polyprenyl-3-methyl-5-hydroxy-6-metoxy-1,4-benzoquinol methylase